MVEFTCPGCNTQLHVPHGFKVQCSCRFKFAVENKYDTKIKISSLLFPKPMTIVAHQTHKFTPISKSEEPSPRIFYFRDKSKGTGPAITVAWKPVDERHVDVGIAYCSKKDRFVKNIGTLLARGRLCNPRYTFRVPVSTVRNRSEVIKGVRAFLLRGGDPNMPKGFDRFLMRGNKNEG